MSSSDSAVLEATSLNVATVQVTIAADGTPVCDPAKLQVAGRNVLIVYQLDADDWVFPARDAVTVKDGAGQFPFPSWTVFPQQAVLFDRNSADGVFHYTVSVQYVPTGEVRSVDPTIYNET